MVRQIGSTGIGGRHQGRPGWDVAGWDALDVAAGGAGRPRGRVSQADTRVAGRVVRCSARAGQLSANALALVRCNREELF